MFIFNNHIDYIRITVYTYVQYLFIKRLQHWGIKHELEAKKQQASGQ